MDPTLTTQAAAATASPMDRVTEAGLCARLPSRVELEFFGARTRLQVASRLEADQWSHFFKRFVRPPATEGAPEPLSVYLELEDSSGSFFESIFRKDYVRKRIFVNEGGRLRLWSRFDTWSGVVSPLPPFMFSPLRERVALFSASSVIAPGSDRCLFFAAPPYQGKSTLMNAIVQRGGRPLADNLSIYDLAQHRAMPYLTPTGLREETLERLPHLREAVQERRSDWVTVSEVTGRVYLIHPEEIHPFADPVPSEPALFVFPIDDRHGTRSDFELVPLSSIALEHRLRDLRVHYTPRADPAPLHRLAAVPAVELRYSLLRSDLDDVCTALLDLAHAGR